MKKIHLIILSLLTISLITHCPASSSGNPTNGTQPPTVDNMKPMIDITLAKTIHVHVNNDDPDDTTVVDLTDSITVAEPTYSILEGNNANIFSIDSSTGVITIADASKITYDDTSGANNNNVHLLKVRASDGSDSLKATEAPLRIVVRGEGGAFITTWKTTGTDETITIPTTGSGYNYTVDWGDNVADTTTYMGDATHTYAAPNTYTVIITGDFPRIFFQGTTTANKAKIQSVEQWGSTAWSSMAGAFDGAINLTVPAVDAPNLTGVTDMLSMFQNASTFNQDINHWDTSSIQDMAFMFQNATTFNQDIGDWNTGMVTSMSTMFSGASAFNQDIGAWNTEKVTNMSSMFRDATAFNQNINGWETGEVTTMGSMFEGARAFNQNISRWNTEKVKNMSGMFNGAHAFNQNIGSWETGEVTNMNAMFANTFVFNQDIGAWNTAKVTNMNSMFGGARAFNQDIGSWVTAKVTTMNRMFANTFVFNQDIGAWNTAKVTNMNSMFGGATAFNQNIRMWNVSAVTAATNCASFADSSVLINENWPTFMNAAAACNP